MATHNLVRKNDNMPNTGVTKLYKDSGSLQDEPSQYDELSLPGLRDLAPGVPK